MRKKIIPFLVVFAIVASSLVPVFATETGSFYKPVGIEEWAETRDPDGGFQNILEDYDSYVTNLETDLGTATLIDGGFRIWFDLYSAHYPLTTTSNYVSSVMPVKGQKGFTWAGVYTMDYGGLYNTLQFTSSYALPCAGYVRIGYVGSWSDSWTKVSFSWSEDNYEAKSQGFKFGILDTKFCMVFTNNESFYINFHPYFDFIPLSGNISDYTTQNVTINSRPSSITGDYGIIGDDGTIIKVDGDMIVDESSNTIYNPVTNTTTNFTNYAYDYSDRSYNLTLEDGSTMKVIYGDENVTINEGDTIYNIYYLVEDDSSGSDSDSGTDEHTHNYTSEITKEPSCLISGVRTFTCSCGDSYTKTISATGHDWVISQQVPTTYDPETGEQTQAGYTVYVCGSCAEQYKSTDGSAPPNGSSGGDDSSGGFGDIIVGLFSVIGDIIGGLLEGALVLATKALEALTGLGDLFAQMIATILGFFGGFIDFLSAMFPFLPEETTTILNFGLILMIAAAVFNKFFK